MSLCRLLTNHLVGKWPKTAEVCMFFFVFCFLLISLIADGPHHYHPACVVTKDLPISPRFTPYDFLWRCKFSSLLTTRQSMVEFYLLTFPRFPLRKKEHKSYFGKNRTHDFLTSRCAGYLLHHSGDDGHTYSNSSIWINRVILLIQLVVS